MINGTSGCEVVVAGGLKSLFAACQDGPGSLSGTFSAAGVVDTIQDSPVTVGGGNIFVGTDKSIAQTSIDVSSGVGSLAPAKRYLPNTQTPLFTGPLVTSTGLVFAPSSGDQTIYGLTFTGNQTPFTQNFATNVNSAPKFMPIFTSSTALAFVTVDDKLHSMSSSGVDSIVGQVVGPTSTPLLGHDGLFYVGHSNALSALDSTGSVAWKVATPGDVNAMTMDCNGTLLAAAGNTIYALITDMMSDPNTAGLADTPWPKFQRDSRNTGNADLPTRWGVRTAPGPGGCIQ
jgi:hypothetical protein